MATWREIHLAAAAEAGRAHRELAVDTSARIDPFAALVASGIVTLRRPLEHASGLYLPAPGGAGGGVLVNVLHPASRQRYTAAHELAHHRRDRRAVIDTETEWLGRDDHNHSDRERFAEAFASWFLMPRGLILATIARLGFTVGALAPAEVYQLGLELGTSYRATANRLRGLGLVDQSVERRLLASTPRAVKDALGARRAARDLRRDVWHVASDHVQRHLRPQEGDVLVVDERETATAGFRWIPGPSTRLQFVDDDYGSGPDDGLIGGQVVHRFRFLVRNAGEAELRLSLSRPWEARVIGERTIPVAADARPSPGIVDSRQLTISRS